MRALRPDRMTYAVMAFVEGQIGSKYVEARMIDFVQTFTETSNVTHIFFTLSAGVDPLKDIEKLGKKMRFSSDYGNFHNVSLGQGQEIVAENAIDIASKKGHWVILQNIHLVAKWLPTLEKKIEATLENSHENYRFVYFIQFLTICTSTCTHIGNSFYVRRSKYRNSIFLYSLYYNTI